jgi:hypothetical protein
MICSVRQLRPCCQGTLFLICPASRASEFCWILIFCREKAHDGALAENFDSDSTRSGVSTPIPDPSDKRLPGIIHTDSYFNQVSVGIFSLVPGMAVTTNWATKSNISRSPMLATWLCAAILDRLGRALDDMLEFAN